MLFELMLKKETGDAVVGVVKLVFVTLELLKILGDLELRVVVVPIGINSGSMLITGIWLLYVMVRRNWLWTSMQ